MKAVIFDLDGTLLNTLEDIRCAINYARRAYGGAEVSSSDTRRYIGNGLYKALKGSFAEHGPAIDDEELALAFQLMMEYYRKHPADHAYPYEGVMGLLRTLRKRGIKVAILSNKADSILQSMLPSSFEGFSFDYAIGHREDFPLKPDRKSFLHVLDALGVKKDDVVYIGDSEVDYQTAINSGVRHIIVTYGFRDREELALKGIEHLIDHVPGYEEILDVFSSSAH